MARSLAAAGHLVLVPEVPSWASLHVDPRHAEPTVRASLARLCAESTPQGSLGKGAWPVADLDRLGLMAFSVAGPWALEVAAGETGHDLRAVVSLGGYGDFRRLVTAMVTGEHEWRGRHYQHTPDPYGRWILGSDLLPRLDAEYDAMYGDHDARTVAGQALHRLAFTAGRNGALAGTPVYDTLIANLRATVPHSALPAWDLLAPPSRRLVPDPDGGRVLANALASAGLRSFPELNASGRLDGLASSRAPRVFLIHGRQDTLVPFTETHRLASLLPRGAHQATLTTRLVGHAKAASTELLQSPATLVREAWRFAATMRRMLRAVEGS
jgi:hypothetical protein